MTLPRPGNGYDGLPSIHRLLETNAAESHSGQALMNKIGLRPLCHT